MKQEEYVKLKQKCFVQFCKESGINQALNISLYEAFDQIYDRAYALGKQFGNSEQVNAEGEEMLTVKAMTVREMYAANDRLIADHIGDEIERQESIINEMFRSLFGSKCLPDELNDDNFAKSEPKPAEPKYHEGDKVRIINDIYHENEYKGDVTEIVYVDNADPDATYKVDIFDEKFGGELWYSESDLEPYTEPTDHIPAPEKKADEIIKDGFREHNRLQIAAMMVPSVIATVPCSENEKGYAKMVATRARILADALISECNKGGKE